MSAWGSAGKRAAVERSTFLTTTTGRTPPNFTYAQASSSAETPMDYRLGVNGNSQVQKTARPAHSFTSSRVPVFSGHDVSMKDVFHPTGQKEAGNGRR